MNWFGGRLRFGNRNCRNFCIRNSGVGVGGFTKPSQFLRRLKRLAGEGNEDCIVRHIFLHRFQTAYHAVLAAVDEAI